MLLINEIFRFNLFYFILEKYIGHKFSFLKKFGTGEMYAIHRTNKLKEDFIPMLFGCGIVQ